MPEDGFWNFTLAQQGKDIYSVEKHKYDGPVVVDEEETIIVECDRQKLYLSQNVFKQKSFDRAKEIVKDTKKMNVLYILLDGMSRANFFRMLPKLVKFMEGPLDNHNVYQFFKYHAIDGHTRRNIGATYSGQYWGFELKVYKYIWEWATEQGYVTAYLRNECRKNNRGDIHLDFPVTFTGDGVKHDHVFGEFWCIDKYVAGSSSRSCISGKNSYDYMFDYATQYLKNYEEVPRFATIHFMESHEPSQSVIANMEESMIKFLEATLSQYPDTAIIFTSDHGMAYGSYSKTGIGKVENYLPLLFTFFPKYFVEENSRHEILMENEQKLISPIDAFKTLMQLIHYPKPPLDLYPVPTPENIRSLFGNEDYCIKYQDERCTSTAYSILKDIIPENRTCEHAEIRPDICQCNSWLPVNFTYTHESMKFLESSIAQINSQVKVNDNCLPLEIVNVANVHEKLGLYMFEIETQKKQTWSIIVKGHKTVTANRLTVYGKEKCNKDNVSAEFCVCK
jgi:hypothetical protein